MDATAKTLMFDMSAGSDIYDDELGRNMSKSEVNETIRNICFEELGITEKSTEKQIKRALGSDKALALNEVIEEVIETKIQYGLSEDDFYNKYVETRNLADGDRNEFWVDDDIILTVSKISGDHHDLSLQRLSAGNAYSIPTAMYGIKVGDNLRLFLTGRKDWNSFVDAAAKAYLNKIQTLISAEFATGTSLIPIPSNLTGNGPLTPSTPGTPGTDVAFNAIIEKVESANNCPAVIMGTKTALKNLNDICDVDWLSLGQKDAFANTGIIGMYQGTELYALPQKFADKTLTTPIVNNRKLWIMPQLDDRFIKLIDGGEVELTINEIGGTMDDLQSYELQRRIGVGTLMSRYHGEWTV